MLLLVLSQVSPPDFEAFTALCLAWPFVVPIALGFNIAAFAHIFGAVGGTQSERRTSLAIAVISAIGTGICGWMIGKSIHTLGPIGLGN